jgi:hypothetical protein
MPLYEHVCRKYRNKFGEALTIKEHETKSCTARNAKGATWKKSSSRSSRRWRVRREAIDCSFQERVRP